MLVSLRLKNLALADDLHWELGPGFNVLSGETGAGKSILIDGLNLLLGERAERTLIRSSEQTCSVEAQLEISEKRILQQINAALEEIGAEPCEGSQLLFKRSFSIGGANKQFANGSPITLQGLKKIGDLLVDVHGPHDHQSLLQSEKQLSILDSYGHTEPALKKFREKFEALDQIQKIISSLETDEQTRTQRLEMLTHQHEEIESAHLKPGEDITIEQNYKIASNAQQLLSLAGTITGLISDSENAALNQLASVEKALLNWQRLDPGISENLSLNRTAIEQLQELHRTVQTYVDRIDADENRLQSIEERLNLLQKIKKKYGPTLEEAIQFGENAAKEIELLSTSDEKLLELKKKEKALTAELNEAANQLSKARRQIAPPLAKKIQQQLRELGFGKALFSIDCREADLSRQGMDRVEFIFAPNQGEEARPLRAIASSGEMARVMLAIKTTLAEVDEIPILVFDEIDANVGGETATQVGKKLRKLGESHQVICITHLPQVAAEAMTHFAVSKKMKNQRTVTELRHLDKKERIDELARMLGGQNEKTRALATSLVE